MSTSNEATNVTIDSKTENCSRCRKLKPIAEFTRIIGSRMTVNISCNACADRDKRYRLNKKAKSTNNESTQPLLLNENIQLPPLDKNIQSLPLNEDDVDADSVGNSSDELLYNIYDIEELINVKFRDSEEKDEPVKFSVIVNLERELVNEKIMSLEIDQNEDTEFREVINTLLLPLQAGSKYYWELRNLYINKKNNQPTGEVPTIERYLCEGNIVVKIDLCEQEVKITFQHLIAHEHPTYRETNLPKNAVEWMHQHLNPRLRKIEIYQRLCDKNLINPSLHTYQQVYYWIHKFSIVLYITDVENQLKSSMNFLEQSELINTGYKVICYQENDFVRLLRFVSSFLRIIKNKNISEIVIDSTFKTN
ncbi:hypothetical protein F8M41_021769 [Gigaspora margarita]|uniref:Uncharacterized protein n=1 Tax=Gigaspora margarita TaxID=4874 RepID=A0A8H4B1G5_GIGMA|nr:hypothetical protein F8M41_021769 [Gigaspora margarita]